jgi:redox-sensitive bicupin YhaK (pirin superfamily)
MQKSVELIMAPPSPHFVGDGFRVHTFIPSSYRIDMHRMNPFIMLDYNSKHYFEPSDTPRGVGVHPHRGFETVTIAYSGKVAHHDSAGGGGIIGEGDVQWMTAASGVLHKEYHEAEFARSGGWFQMVQLWVNLPSKFKMSAPKYQAISNSQMKTVPIQGTGYVELIAGNFQSEMGPASTFSPVHISNAKLKTGDVAEYSFPAYFNTAMIVVEGEVMINGTEHAPLNHFILMENNGEDFTITASQDSTVLVLSGEPINEPIAAHGPFVMNTHQELVEAFNDFNNGKFGYLD